MQCLLNGFSSDGLNSIIQAIYALPAKGYHQVSKKYEGFVSDHG